MGVTTESMKTISVLIKPGSGSCNIDCSYCFYKDLQESGDVNNQGIMTDFTMKALIENVFVDLDNGDSIEFAFQGGEPTLIGIDFYKSFVKYVKSMNRPRVNVSYSLQTNGIVIDENWCRFFNENKFLIGLSMDGPKYINDKYRLDYKGKGTYEKIIRVKNMFDKYKVEYNILSVLTNELSRKPEEMWKFIKDENIKYIQFIPCLDDIDNKSHNEYALSPENFAYFYKSIFKLWEKSLYNNEYHSIGLIEQLITLLNGQSSGSCSIRGRCNPQYVIEADGSVYPCDFYVLEKYKAGNINTDSLRELFYNEAMQDFLTSNKSISNYCKKCEYFTICNGGCKRLENAIYLNQREDFCGYKTFLDSAINDMVNIGNAIL